MRVRLTLALALLGAVGLPPGVATAQYQDGSAGSVAPPTGEQALFADLPVVEAAALHAQTLEQAPASVTVITAADIRTYGYRTLGEALSSVRGFYMTNDRLYRYMGLRGFSLPGDYNTRFLVMINGHPMTERLYSSSIQFGQDFGLDMDLVERIEVIRGPTSALYGSNGILANINVVTKSPVDLGPLRVSTETGSFGERKAMVSSSMYLGKGANLLVSAAVFHNAGQDHYFPEFDTPANNNGQARDADAERGYHTYAQLIWREWSVIGYFNSREKQAPLPWLDAMFNNRANHVVDSRNFVGVTYSHEGRADRKLQWTLFYDQYRYDDRFDYDVDGEIRDYRAPASGDWVSSQANYSFPVRRLGRLTIGAQASVELRNLQLQFQMSPVRVETVRVSRPDRTGALFAQQEWAVSRRWKAYLGLRVDGSHNFGVTASPRLALVYERSPRTVYKLVYGRPFRNPNAYEQYYDDHGLSMAAGGDLRPETAQTFEVSVERKLGRGLASTVNAYRYELNNLIQAAYLSDSIVQYRNALGIRATGVEVELAGKPARWLEAAGSFSLQRARMDTQRSPLPNSPAQVGKARMAVPLAQGRLKVSTAFQFLGRREDRSGGPLRSVVLGDLTLTSYRLRRGFDVQAGVRNLLDWRYQDPTGLALDRLRADGRSCYLKLIWGRGE